MNRFTITDNACFDNLQFWLLSPPRGLKHYTKILMVTGSFKLAKSVKTKNPRLENLPSPQLRKPQSRKQPNLLHLKSTSAKKANKPMAASKKPIKVFKKPTVAKKAKKAVAAKKSTPTKKVASKKSVAKKPAKK
ncbi:histone H1-gamma, late-like [Artemia franciscana]|uniref:histone H1-gamma, late-like n=1 Tax=Artemia franciscana TaxID=6661 RepID=UPI0032DA1971